MFCLDFAAHVVCMLVNKEIHLCSYFAMNVLLGFCCFFNEGNHCPIT